MVVDEDESVGTPSDYRTEYFAGMCGGFADRADRNHRGANVPETGVHHGDEDLLLGEMAELRREEIVDSLRCVDRNVPDLLAGHADAEFKGGGELRSLGQAEPAFFGEFRHWQGTERAHGPIFRDQVTADIDRAAPAGSGGNEQGHQLRVVQGGRTEPGEFFPRALFGRKVLNAIERDFIGGSISECNHANSVQNVSVIASFGFAMARKIFRC